MPYKDPEKRRSHHREYMRERWRNGDEAQRRKHMDANNRARVIRRKARRSLLDVFRSEGCRICGERAHCCLAAHHIDPAEKDFNIAEGVSDRTEAATLAELRKCVCLCHDCHSKVHAGLLVSPKPIPS